MNSTLNNIIQKYMRPSVILIYALCCASFCLVAIDDPLDVASQLNIANQIAALNRQTFIKNNILHTIAQTASLYLYKQYPLQLAGLQSWASSQVQVFIGKKISLPLYNPESLASMAALHNPETMPSIAAHGEKSSFAQSILPYSAIFTAKFICDHAINNQVPCPSPYRYPNTWWHTAANWASYYALQDALARCVRKPNFMHAGLCAAAGYAAYHAPQQIDTLLKTGVIRAPLAQRWAFAQLAAPLVCCQLLTTLGKI